MLIDITDPENKHHVIIDKVLSVMKESGCSKKKIESYKKSMQTSNYTQLLEMAAVYVKIK